MQNNLIHLSYITYRLCLKEAIWKRNFVFFSKTTSKLSVKYLKQQKSFWNQISMSYYLLPFIVIHYCQLRLCDTESIFEGAAELLFVRTVGLFALIPFLFKIALYSLSTLLSHIVSRSTFFSSYCLCVVFLYLLCCISAVPSYSAPVFASPF